MNSSLQIPLATALTGAVANVSVAVLIFSKRLVAACGGLWNSLQRPPSLSDALREASERTREFITEWDQDSSAQGRL